MVVVRHKYDLGKESLQYDETPASKVHKDMLC